MSSFQEARDALVRVLFAVFPDAKPVPRWAGVEAWAAPRPEAVVDPDAKGTYDPRVTVVGIADRKSGPTVYFLDPGDYFVLDTHRRLLEDAGLKLGRGCIMHTRKGPLPADALEALFRAVKTRDAQAARKATTAPRKAPAAKKAAAKKAVARKAAAKPARTARGATDPGAASVDAYLADLPGPQREALERLRRQVLAAAPRATEKMAYGMPTFVHEGNLVHMAAFQAHCTFFVGRAMTDAFRREIGGFGTSKAGIRFTPEKPLPARLVARIVKMRVAENEARAAQRRAKKVAAGRGARKAGAKKAAPRKARKGPAKGGRKTPPRR